MSERSDEQACLQVESAGAAVVLTMDRPQTNNAISRALAAKIRDEVSRASADPKVRAIVLAGAGDRVFSAGGDLHEIQASVARGAAADVLDMFGQLSSLETCSVPVIAAVQGDVFGGAAELILLCDFVIAEEQAHIAFRHARMGLSPAWGGMTRLVERVGTLEATRLLLTAEKILAADAARIGLVSEVVPRGFARERALARVSHICDNPRDTVTAIKRALHEVRAALRAPAVGVEREAFRERWGSPDHVAAMKAFRERK
jgi:enoyl-CoA hydratase